MNIRNLILCKIDAFRARVNMSDRQFGMAVAKDSKLMKRLRTGHGVTLTTIEKAEEFVVKNGGTSFSQESGQPDKPVAT